MTTATIQGNHPLLFMNAPSAEQVKRLKKVRHDSPTQFMKKILIAEDDKKIAAALEIRLEAAGYEVLVLSDGFRSYMRSMTEQPDLILMDIFLPIGSGLAVVQELRAAGLADIPIIFMTASKLKNLRARAEMLNAAGFFEKPFDMEKMLATISRVLQSNPSTTVTHPPACASNERITK